MPLHSQFKALALVAVAGFSGFDAVGVNDGLGGGGSGGLGGGRGGRRGGGWGGGEGCGAFGGDGNQTSSGGGGRAQRNYLGRVGSTVCAAVIVLKLKKIE